MEREERRRTAKSIMGAVTPEHSELELIVNAILSVLKYIGIGFISITGMFFLWLIGQGKRIIKQYKSEHDTLYSVYLDATGKSAEKLKAKLKDDEKKQNDEFMHLVNRVLQLEENYQGVMDKLDEVEKLILHKDNNYSQNTQVMLKVLMDIQDKIDKK